ncbi:hypothetical protein KEN51_CDS0027 [Pseudomonas phage vB_Pae10145-KEN51]|uniref:PHIKZ010.1 n=3 Tax=Phikzvirus TaxID=680115 RepID=L7T0I8_BPDPK|nr:hypothetical protein [Pseudomonas aeruginosa]YP_009617314.1 hypothetical protein FDI90_gp026 [Pseudomonas phage PA7]YP_009639884.1 PHIKZ010.1 [Pseudomonas phage phiKZ]ANM44769.1 hypothetical protein KTN4_011 [Pseudomonas phage KTN4]QGK90008.1 hypothetical protein [Pseudomonas phage vB_PA32_GUMS]QOV07865.1 hypothetical protein [Pseudomonas phage vB_PaeM_kmuB]QYV98919.1 hypothetical protein [Pseudomonas phage T2P]QYV99176.1 hypothetical protein [Pseudomonas phage U1B]QYV99631.1 hypothetica
MKAFALVVIGLTFGGLFVNAKFEEQTISNETVILGHRIGPNGQEMLVTK